MKIKLNQIKLNWILQDHKNKDPHYKHMFSCTSLGGNWDRPIFPPDSYSSATSSE